jgi:ATP-dependent Clp protease, protease subunit
MATCSDCGGSGDCPTCDGTGKVKAQAKAARQWFTMKAEPAGTAEIFIYDEIGQSFWNDNAVSAKQFVADLNALGDVSAITLRINSPGGDVFDGVAIHNALKNHKATVTAQIDGIAASAASFIAMAADKIVMPSNSFMLVHGASGFAYGSADTVRALADDLDRIDKSMTATYAARSKSSAAKVKALMKEDRLMDAAEAQAFGFADEVTEPVKLAAKFPLRLLPTAAAEKFFAAAGDPEDEPEDKPEDKPTDPATDPAQPKPAPVVEPPQPTAQVITLDAAKKQGAEEHRAYVASVTDLCTLAAAPERVGAYVRASTPLDQVRKELLARRAEEPVVMPHHPLVPPAQAAASSWSKITDKINARLKK